MKPGRIIEASEIVKASGAALNRLLLVDLNNFSSFPTLAVGILTASLRNAGFYVQLISPLAHDVPATEREKPETWYNQLERRVHLSTWRPFASTRDAIRTTRFWWRNRPHPRVLAEVRRALESKPDAILLSAYLQHYGTVVEIGRLAQAAGVKLLLGGPMFNLDGTADYWRHVPGLTALVGGEADLSVGEIVSAVCSGDDLLRFEGVVLPDGRRGPPARPLRALNSVPVPDFTDFPWDRYPVRIIPMMASRGCQWNRCTFCSDILSVSGRTFRTRTVDSVIHEMREQARRHTTTNFLFLDLKLNSNPNLLRGIVENVQRNVRGAQWIGTVHVDGRSDNGLSRGELRAAVAAGMRRVSFGLESGSQKMLDAMDKGCTVERNSEFIRTAHEAGLSVRATMFKGYPGETAEDIELTAQFLEKHADYIGRVRFNDFSILPGTPVERAVRADPALAAGFEIINADHRNARVRYRNRATGGRAYRRAKGRVIRIVHDINRRRLRSSAREFDGLM